MFLRVVNTITPMYSFESQNKKKKCLMKSCYLFTREYLSFTRYLTSGTYEKYL